MAKKTPQQHRHRLITETLHDCGPLAVRAVVPRYADEDFKRHGYSPWYLANIDESKLDDDVINAHFKEWRKGKPDEEGGAEMMEFFDALDGVDGYIVLHSTTEGYCVLEAD